MGLGWQGKVFSVILSAYLHGCEAPLPGKFRKVVTKYKVDFHIRTELLLALDPWTSLFTFMVGFKH
jgi:hypothetical protein